MSEDISSSYTINSLLKGLTPNLSLDIDIHYLANSNSNAKKTQVINVQSKIVEGLKDTDVGRFSWQNWSSTEQWLVQAQLNKPSVVIYRLPLAELESAQVVLALESLLTALTKRSSPTAIIILGQGLSGATVASLFKRGVVDYIPINIDEEPPSSIEANLVEAILRAKTVTTERAKLGRLQQMYRRLTKKEQQVAHQIMQGHINKVMADNLDISVRTVEVRRAQVMKKMQSSHSSDLIKKLLLINLWTVYAQR